MLGLFGLFGRSKEIQALDFAIRAEGLHPRLVPDAVKMTVVRLVRDAGLDDVTPAAPLLVHCIVGPDEHAASVGPDGAAAVTERITVATEAGDSLDARLVLLCMTAAIIHPDVVEDHGLNRG
ncbi:hypothetical protein [Roseospira navarrensis]|uniref:Uncharacterized protein n=1 Tax=Roseospira navarrensis TaxID=140058 RepID=A0A7X1ZIF6_9PROT|nr:hypothetical protein [Roseospira navarrensis]MQX38042.1 hypothetical protein [Roseospira navarrensis]